MSSSQQSPIDLTDPVYADLGDRGLEVHWTGHIHGQIVKQEHGLKVTFDPNPDHFIVLDRKRFYLVSFHFHSRSEHWVDGKQHAVELHVVHQSARDDTIAVIGIFIEPATCEPCETTQPALEFMSQLMTYCRASADERGPARVSTDPNDFLPPRTDQYYRYEGSLTTPEFNENVSWVVFRNPFLIDRAGFEKVIAEFEEPARFPQPPNRRFVLATFRPDNASSQPAKEPGSSVSESPKARRPKPPKKR